MKKRALGTVFATLLFSTHLSTASTFADDVLTVDPIMVEADLTAIPATSSYAIDGGHSSDAPYADGADYFRSLPGVTASRMGGHGLEPFIRGQSEARLNIVNDDSYTFGACPNRMDPPTAYMNLSAHDEVRVVRGYQSVLNGFGGSGGSIIIESNTPDFGKEFEYKGEASGGYDGNSNMRHSNGKVTAGTQYGYVKAHTAYKNADNYDDGDGNEVRAAFEEISGGFLLGYTPEASHIYAGFDYHRIEDALFPGAGMDSPLSEGQTFKVGLERKLDGPVFKTIDVSGYASFVDHEMDNFSLRPLTAPTPLRVESESDTYGLKLKSDLMIANRPIESVLQWRRNNRNADRINNNTDQIQSLLWPDITIDEISVAAETTYDLGLKTRLVAGARYDFAHVDYGRANEAASAGMGLTPNQIYTQFYGITAEPETEHNLGGLLRLEHDYSIATMFYTGISRSVRTADATERGLANFMGAGGSTSWVGNPGIKPEKHHQLDAGFEIQKPKWVFGSSAYANVVEDYILRDSARAQPGILVNFPNADIYRNIDAFLTGFEMYGQWQIQPKWSLQGDATYTFGQDMDAGRSLPQIPPLQGKLGITWQALHTLEIGTKMRWAIEQNRVDTDPATGTGRDVDRTNEYAVFDIEGRLTKLDPVSLSFGMTNVFDKTYAAHLSRSNISDPTEVQVNEPGRSFYIKMTVPF